MPSPKGPAQSGIEEGSQSAVDAMLRQHQLTGLGGHTAANHNSSKEGARWIRLLRP
jgi:hypothetical protein